MARVLDLLKTPIMEIHAWVGIEISLCQQSEPEAPTRAHTHTQYPMQEGMAGLETLFSLYSCVSF